MNWTRRRILSVFFILSIIAQSSLVYAQTSSIPLGETVYFDCDTFDPTTGAPASADSTPTFNVYEDATDTPIINGTSLTARSGHTGEYRGTYAVSSGNGFEVGKWYSAKCYATVGGLEGNAIRMHFRVTPSESTEGYAPVDVELYRNSTPNALVSGRPEVYLGAAATNAFDAASIATSAVAKLQTGVFTIKKNTAKLYYFKLRNADGTAYTAGTSSNITCSRSLDGAAFGGCAGSTTASISHLGNGRYKATLATTDVNADDLWLIFGGPLCSSEPLNCSELIITTQH